MHKLAAGFAVFAVGMLGMGSVAAAGIELSLDTAGKEIGSGKVEYTLTNNSGATIHVLRWQTPVDGVTNDLFRVTQFGRNVAYVGPMFKRVEPRPQDYVELKPGERLSAEVDLSAVYDMRGGGQFDVSYAREASDVVQEAAQARSGGADSAVLRFDLKQASTSVFADAAVGAMDAFSASPDAEARSGLVPLAATNSFVSCSNTRQTQLATARNSATSYASNSKNYLTAGTQGSRYTWWFGTYNSSRYSTARTHFNNIHSALSSQPFTFNCSCTDSGTYAYVYPTQPYKVYLCGAFWSAPNTGTDSRAGTIVHEVSHFNVMGGTDDWAYGQSAAHSLAVSNPNKAVDNADNHEYFAENTPARN